MSRVGAGVHKLSFGGLILKAGLAMLLLPFGLCAPTVMGTLRGRITDWSGAAVAKALIAVISSNGRIRLGASNAQGLYAIHDLDPGLYTLWATQGTPPLLETAQLGITRGQVEPVDIKLSASRQHSGPSPTSRKSRMDLAGLEVSIGLRRPVKRDAARNFLTSIETIGYSQNL
jgi:Carboxypeptidase regulatory-like domain